MEAKPLKIFKVGFDYLSRRSVETMLQLLKKNVLNTKPHYYGVVRNKAIETCDGPMQALLIAEDLEDPAYEPIAECRMNGRFYYFWRDEFWGVAQNKKGEPLQTMVHLQQVVDKDENVFQRGDKKVVLYLIGGPSE